MMTGRNIKKSTIKILNLCTKVTNQISATTSIHLSIYLSSVPSSYLIISIRTQL